MTINLQLLEMWIPVNQTLPEKCTRVLIFYQNSCRDDLIDIAWFDAGLWWLTSKVCLSRNYTNVAYWMPLPQPPTATEWHWWEGTPELPEEYGRFVCVKCRGEKPNHIKDCPLRRINSDE